MEFDAVFQWNMTPAEVDVYKLAVAYEQEFRKVFGSDADGQSYLRNRIPMRGDPRKSNLFRQCWRLRRETRGLLEPHEYRNYIKANLTIIKLHNGHVEPNCICGDKAWIRYKVWKRLYDQKMSDAGAVAPPPSVSSTSPKIIAEIDKTKKFLFERCEGEVSFDKIKNFVDSGIFKFWVASGKVSPYYAVLSPFLARTGNLDQIFTGCSTSQAVILGKITDEIRNYFNHEYKHESVT